MNWSLNPYAGNGPDLVQYFPVAVSPGLLWVWQLFRYLAISTVGEPLQFGYGKIRAYLLHHECVKPYQSSFYRVCNKPVRSLTECQFSSGKRIECVTNNYPSLEMDTHCVSQMTAVNWIGFEKLGVIDWSVSRTKYDSDAFHVPIPIWTVCDCRFHLRHPIRLFSNLEIQRIQSG